MIIVEIDHNGACLCDGECSEYCYLCLSSGDLQCKDLKNSFPNLFQKCYFVLNFPTKSNQNTRLQSSKLVRSQLWKLRPVAFDNVSLLTLLKIGCLERITRRVVHTT